MANYKNPKKSEPEFPPAGQTIYTGPNGGTYTITDGGNKIYFGNNGR